MEIISAMQLKKSIIVDYLRSIVGRLIIGIGCSISASGPFFKDTYLDSKEGIIFVTNLAWIFNTIIMVRNLDKMKFYTAGFGFTFLTITLSIGVIHGKDTES